MGLVHCMSVDSVYLREIPVFGPFKWANSRPIGVHRWIINKKKKVETDQNIVRNKIAIDWNGVKDFLKAMHLLEDYGAWF